MSELPSQTPLDIIVAEDEAITRHRLVTALETMGHKVRSYADGLSAWEAYLLKPSRVIISDWQMPHLEGPAFCARVRELDLPDYTYFILATAMQTVETDYETASDAGTDDFLMKPLTPEGLWRRLRVARRILGLDKEIGRLKELIPICAYCRQVREDDNYWSNLEQYVQAHTSSRFSHGICPQCYAKVMRDFERDRRRAAEVLGITEEHLAHSGSGPNIVD